MSDYGRTVPFDIVSIDTVASCRLKRWFRVDRRCDYVSINTGLLVSIDTVAPCQLTRRLRVNRHGGLVSIDTTASCQLTRRLRVD